MSDHTTVLEGDSVSEAAQCTDELAASLATRDADTKSTFGTAAGVQAPTYQPTMPSPPALPAPVSERMHLSAADQEAGAASQETCTPPSMTTVTLLVPTMFTTASGRPLCVREVRSVRRDSAEWRLWNCTYAQAAQPADSGFFRGAASVASHTGGTDSCGKEGSPSHELQYLPHFQPPWRQCVRWTAPHETHTHNENPDDEATLRAAGVKRARSCPMHLSTAEAEARDCPLISLRTQYSGFTRADGSMIFLR